MVVNKNNIYCQEKVFQIGIIIFLLEQEKKYDSYPHPANIPVLKTQHKDFYCLL